MAKDVDIIKEKLDFVDFMKSYIALSSAGKNLKGLCPFHQETKPSFMVSPERKIWHCFGCGAGGDLIKFAMLYENLEFPEALRLLAEKAGVEIESFAGRDQKELGIIYDINEFAKKFFVQELSGNKEAENYLYKRGLNKEVIEEFELGYSYGGDRLTTRLLGAGFALDQIIKAGISFKNQKGLYRDKFIRRIMFPIVSDIGKTVAFTGRTFPEGNDDVPKYLNSPETPVFNKSKILYGLYKGKSEIVKTRTAFLVEGQMDFLMMWSSGVKNVVAVSGTALTSLHLSKLKRLADTVLVTFDNDEGGLRALERAIDVFGNFDFHVRAVNLGQYSDPAEACLADPDFFKRAVSEARPAFIHLFDTYFRKRQITDVAEKKKIIRHLLGKIKNIKSSIEQDGWVKELSNYSGVSEPALCIELEGVGGEVVERLDNSANLENLPVGERIDLISVRLLQLAFTDDKLFPILKTSLNFLPSVFREVVDNPRSDKAAILDLQSSWTIGNIGMEEAEKECLDLVKNLKIEFLKKKQSELTEQMVIADNKNDDGLTSLAGEFHNVASQIEDLKKG